MESVKRSFNLLEMCETQDKLNKFIEPHWRNKSHKNFLHANRFCIAAIFEMVELVSDSNVNYKWWKHHSGEVDKWNVKIEAIDILHFVLGIVITKSQELYDKPLIELLENKELGHEKFNMDGVERLINNGNLNSTMFFEFISALIQFTALPERSGTSEFEFVSYVYGILNSLFVLLRMPSDEISAIYMAKVTLNEIRQSDGYKNGTYVKIQDGVEDNQKLEPIVREFLEDDTKSLNWIALKVRSEMFKSTR